MTGIRKPLNTLRKEPNQIIKLTKKARWYLALLFWLETNFEKVYKKSSVFRKIVLQYHSYRGVAQLVARDVRDVEAAGSNPVTPTKKEQVITCSFFIDIKVVLT